MDVKQNEKWVQCIEHEDLMVSNIGRVFSKTKDKILNTKHYTAYPQIQYRGNLFQLHRLVANAFVPNPDNKPFVNHINCDKQDYSIENLEWVTAKENSQHAALHGLLGKYRVSKTGYKKGDKFKRVPIYEKIKSNKNK